MSKRNIAMLLRWVLVALGVEHLQRSDQAAASVARLDHRINVAALGRNIGVRESIAEFFDLLLPRRIHCRIIAVWVAGCLCRTLQLALVNNVYRALRTHDGDF